MEPLWFAVALLATWRLSLMVTRERGPLNVMVHLRTLLYKIKGLGELAECLWCISVWVGIIATALLLIPRVRWLLVPFALSGGSLLIHGIFRDDRSDS